MPPQLLIAISNAFIINPSPSAVAVASYSVGTRATRLRARRAAGVRSDRARRAGDAARRASCARTAADLRFVCLSCLFVCLVRLVFCCRCCVCGTFFVRRAQFCFRYTERKAVLVGVGARAAHRRAGFDLFVCCVEIEFRFFVDIRFYVWHNLNRASLGADEPGAVLGAARSHRLDCIVRQQFPFRSQFCGAWYFCDLKFVPPHTLVLCRSVLPTYVERLLRLIATSIGYTGTTASSLSVAVDGSASQQQSRSTSTSTTSEAIGLNRHIEYLLRWLQSTMLAHGRCCMLCVFCY